MHIPFFPILLALGATAAVLNPAVARDSVAADAAVFDPVAADAAVLERRGNNYFKKLRCTGAYGLQLFACEAVASYKHTCIYIANIDYGYCKYRAQNGAPAPDPSEECPATCKPPALACVAVCVSSNTSHLIL